MLAFTLVGYNIDRIRSFTAKKQAAGQAPKSRAKRRFGTYSDVLSSGAGSGGRAPPV